MKYWGLALYPFTSHGVNCQHFFNRNCRFWWRYGLTPTFCTSLQQPVPDAVSDCVVRSMMRRRWKEDKLAWTCQERKAPRWVSFKIQTRSISGRGKAWCFQPTVNRVWLPAIQRHWGSGNDCGLFDRHHPAAASLLHLIWDNCCYGDCAIWWRPAFGGGGGLICIQHFPKSERKYNLIPRRVMHYELWRKYKPDLKTHLFFSISEAT